MRAERERIERGGFFLFLALVTVGLLYVVGPFLGAILWAALAAIMFQPLFQRILRQRPSWPNQAALATLAIIFFAILLPLLVIGSIVLDQAVNIYLAFRRGDIDVFAFINQIQGALPASIQAQLDSSGWGDTAALQQRLQEFVSASAGAIAGYAVAIGGGAFGFVLAFGVGLYVTYFLLRDGHEIAPKVVAALPIDEDIALRLLEKFMTIVRATIKGSIVVGMVQGALGAITFWIVGVPSAILFGVLMALFSLLPALGPAIVWLPVAIWLLATGGIWQGLVVIGSGIFVIGLSDNILRPILVGRDTGIPDWIILVTTLGGIATMGLIGIIAGPLLAGLFIAGWTILKEERGATVRPLPHQ
ncbi:AI-2E family transporter [Altererythrobacter aurantiacus]|uniref:AI-2E family transporter n=1 Tax=Parapontixanthobacter aurantiacus TaxID=1463599 RepID=A0A844ZFL7_9SPHN|nr:AI-2E family transporter [Parapontixanthobacter aurantiacus]MXO86655.1 AI-2E family transporter [Parapontixanthobacter aurantiacus]